VEQGAAAMNVIFVLWLREVKRYLRSRPQIIASLAQPLLYLLVLGYGLNRYVQIPGTNYVQFVVPGVICMGILFTSIFSGIGLLWDRQFGFLKETLVAPVPRLQIMAGRTLGGATIAVIQGTLVLVVCVLFLGFRPVSLAAIPQALLFMALIAIVFAALGTAIGSTLRDMQGFQMIMNFLIMPIFFLSGALFPLANQGMPLAVATRVDPLSYGVDGVRAALIGLAQIGIAVDVLVLGVLATAFLMLGAWAFSRIQV
jgi:ABC-2 type transport system permease protein